MEISFKLARQFSVVCLSFVALLAAVSADEKQKQMPFSVELGEPFTFDGVPPLQAFAHAHADVDGTKWLFVTGRHNGLHGFSEPTPEDPENDFAVRQANQHLWVIDIENRKVWKSPLDAAKHLITDPLRASNCLHCQVGDKLYVVGGYGATAASRTTGNMTTFNSLTRIDVPQVINAVIKKTYWGRHVLQTYDDALRVTGGGMLPLGEDLIIVFGQVFDGLYSPAVGQSSGVFFQKYTRQIRRVKLSEHVRLGVSVESYPDYSLGQPQPNDPSDPYRRRDLTVAPAISPSGKARIAAYGGVFRPGQFEAYFKPIYVDQIAPVSYSIGTDKYTCNTFLPGMDTQASQILNQYDCAHLCMHSEKTGMMYTTFFGGISSYYYDRKTDELKKDRVVLSPDGRPLIDGMPFVDTVSLLEHDSNSVTTQYIMPAQMPELLGAEAAFLMNPSVPKYPNGVMKLDDIKQRTTIGYIYGGIHAQAPYTNYPKKTETTSYNQFIPVIVSPRSSQVRRLPPIPLIDDKVIVEPSK